MELYEKCNLTVVQARYEPHLPRGFGEVQWTPSQLFARTENEFVIDWGNEWVGLDVVCDVECLSIDPQGCAQPESGSTYYLTKSGNEMDSLFDRSPGGL